MLLIIVVVFYLTGKNRLNNTKTTQKNSPPSKVVCLNYILSCPNYLCAKPQCKNFNFNHPFSSVVTDPTMKVIKLNGTMYHKDGPSNVIVAAAICRQYIFYIFHPLTTYTINSSY